MAVAIGRMGMSLSDFMELTPVEFTAIFKEHQETQLQFFEYQQLAVYMGFGQANGSKKFKSAFRQKKQAPVRIVSEEQKQKELDEILKRLER